MQVFSNNTITILVNRSENIFGFELNLTYGGYFDIMSMCQLTRICITIPAELDKELRIMYGEYLKSGKRMSFSKFISYLIKEHLSEKKIDEWYSQHDCMLVKL